MNELLNKISNLLEEANNLAYDLEKEKLTEEQSGYMSNLFMGLKDAMDAADDIKNIGN